jgi:ribonuclease HII
MPDFALENEQGGLIIGVDEVGRGPLAGPVVAAAVHIPSHNRRHPVWKDVQDSKKLSSVRREILFSVIQSQCYFGIAEASVEEIDKLNILQATFLAMRRAIEMISIDNPYILIDGNRLPKDWPWETRAIIKGDSKSVSIAAASILAKVTRDRMMEKLGSTYPQYGWNSNAGYGTANHLSALDTYGITEHHRKTFAPVRDIIGNKVA